MGDFATTPPSGIPGQYTTKAASGIFSVCMPNGAFLDFGNPSGGGSGIASVVAGTGVSVNITDPANPIVAVVPDPTAADISASAPGDAKAAGAVGKPADAGHKHSREAFAAPTVALGSAAAAGSAATLMRSDATLAAFDATVPTTSALADAAAVGTAAFAARRDHLHGRESLNSNAGSIAAVATTAAAGAVGTASDAGHAHVGVHTIVAGTGITISGASGDVTVNASGGGGSTDVFTTINVKDHGAVGDGVTDDTAALNVASALAAGKVLFFPKGKYFVTGPVYIKNGTMVQGTGWASNDATIGSVILVNNAGGSAFINADVGAIAIQDVSANARDGVTVRDLGFFTSAGTNANQCTGISMPGGVAILIEHCVFNGLGTSIRCKGGTVNNLKVRGNYFISSNTPANFATVIVWDGGQGIYYENNYFKTCDIPLLQIATGLADATGIRVCGNVSESPAELQDGLFLRELSGNKIDNVFVTDNDFSQQTTVAIHLSWAATSSRRYIRGNAGYNPVGYLASQPAVPASGTPLVNTTGVDWTVYVDTAGGLSAVAVGGTSTGFTPVGGSSYSVPAGQSIAFTYTVTTPTIAVFGN